MTEVLRMEITIDVRYLTQEEFDVLNQLNVNAGIRREAERQRMLQAQTLEAQQQKRVKSATTRRHRKTVKRSRKKGARLSEDELKQIYLLNKSGKSIAAISNKVRLPRRKIRGVLQRFKLKPSALMKKIMKK